MDEWMWITGATRAHGKNDEEAGRGGGNQRDKLKPPDK